MALSSLQLFEPDRSGPLLTAAETRALLGPLSFAARHGEPARLTTRSAQFAPGAAALVHRATLRAVYDLPASAGGGQRVRWWRLSATSETTGDAQLDVEATWRPLWLDAAETLARDRAATGGDLTLALTQVSPAAALAALCDPANGGPERADGAALLTPGVVAPGLPASVDLVLDGPTTLGALEALATTIGAEYVARVVPGPTPEADVYAVDLVLPEDAAAPVATVTLARDGSTAERLRRTEDDADALSVLTPVAPGARPAGTLAGNRWAIASSAGNAVALARRSHEVEGAAAPLVVWEDGALVGHRVLLLNADGTEGATRTVTATAAPNTLTLDGGPGAAVALRLLDPDGAPLVSLESPALAALLGRVEQRIEFPAVHPRANLVEQAGRLGGGTGSVGDPDEGVSADMSAWVPDGSRPYGVSPRVGGFAPTFTRETAPEHVRYGTASLRVVAPDAGGGAAVQIAGYVGDVSVWTGLRVLSGTVQLRVVYYEGAVGQGIVAKEGARVAADGQAGDDLAVWRDPTIALSSDVLPAEFDAADSLQVQLVSVDGPAEFVWDAVTVVGSPQPVPYSPHMGPEALHEAAARELARRAASGLDEYDLDALDLAELGVAGPNGVVGKPLAVGDLVRLRLTRRDAASVEELDLRVLESEYAEGVGAPPVAKRVRLGRALPTLREALRRLAGSVSGAASGGAAGGGGLGSAGVVPGTPAALVAPEAAQGTGPEAGTVVVAFDVPAAPDPEAADADTGQPATAVDVYLSHGGRQVLAEAVRTADLDALRAAGVERAALSVDVLGVGPHAVTVVPSRAGVEGPAAEFAVDVVAEPYGTGGPHDLPDVADYRRQNQAWGAQWRWRATDDPRSAGVAFRVDVEGVADTRVYALPTSADGFDYRPIPALRGRRFRGSAETVAADEPLAEAVLRPETTLEDADSAVFGLYDADGVFRPFLLT